MSGRRNVLGSAWRPAALGAVLAVLACSGEASAQPGAAAAAPRVRSGASVTPDTVTVGDPFVVQLRVQLPAGAQVSFPVEPDSGAAVELLDPRRETRGASGDLTDVTAIYRMAAWDVGDQPLALGDVVVRVDGVERRLPLAALRVHVRSVLPADSAERVPKPARAPIPDYGLWWLPLALLALAVLAAIALLVWAARRWYRRRRPVLATGAAYREALAAFERLDRLGLVAAGEPGRHVALAIEVLRDYLAARLPEARPSHTSGELVAALGGRPEVPHERLDHVFGVADLVKFAAVPVGAAAAADTGREARALVEEVEHALRAREQREAEEAARVEAARRAEQRRYEEARRRAAREAKRGGRGASPDQERAA